MRKKQSKTEHIYRSGLARQIKEFLEEKRRLGFKYIREELELQNLDRFCEQYACEDCLPQELVLAWTEQKPHQSAQTMAFKASVIRGLAAFMQRNGLEAYLLPRSFLPKQTHDHAPYIFTHEEISRLLHVIDAIPYNPLSPKRYLIYPLLFRFLYCCGLRISEALNLKLENVDVKNGVLEILDAKAYRDRLVPLDPMLRERCKRYIQQMFPIAEPGQFFFPAPDGKPYHVFTVRKAFRDLMWKAGISYHGRNVGPRLHDLRHTFAVHSLQKLTVEQGKDPQAVLPVLAVYMGHKTYIGTGRYLHLTAELFSEVLEKVESAFGSLLPEMEVPHE